MARPRSLKYSLSLLLTVPMVRGGARCVKDDLVVLPKALEEPQGSAIAVAVPRCKLQNFGRGSVPVDGAEQPVLERVDSANKISKFVRPVYQHRDAANAHRPWQWRCNLTSGNSAGEGALRHAGCSDCREGRPDVADPGYDRGRSHGTAHRRRPGGMAQVFTTLFNLAMRLERERFLGAGLYERNPDRRGYANGYKSKTLDTTPGR